MRQAISNAYKKHQLKQVTKSEIAPNILTSFAWFQNHEDGEKYICEDKVSLFTNSNIPILVDDLNSVLLWVTLYDFVCNKLSNYMKQLLHLSIILHHPLTFPTCLLFKPSNPKFCKQVFALIIYNQTQRSYQLDKPYHILKLLDKIRLQNGIIF